MKKIIVWDLPIRIFHWSFAASIILALVIALVVDDKDPVFRYHMLFGLSAGAFLILRLVIAVAGARYSRISGLLFKPAETFRYLYDSVAGTSQRYIGHNPGTALAALAMFVLAIGLIWTGVSTQKEVMEDVHPVLAYILLAAIAAHLSGILLHTVRHQENIALSIITGKKAGPEEAALKGQQIIAGSLAALGIAFWFVSLFGSYDSATSRVRIPLTGQTIVLDHEEVNGGVESGEKENE